MSYSQVPFYVIFNKYLFNAYKAQVLCCVLVTHQATALVRANSDAVNFLSQWEHILNSGF